VPATDAGAVCAGGVACAAAVVAMASPMKIKAFTVLSFQMSTMA